VRPGKASGHARVSRGMTRSTVCTALVAAALLACSGGGAGGGSPSNPSGGDASATGDGGGTSSPDGGDSGSTSSSDGGGADGGAGEGSASYATPYFPLAVGLSWTWPGCSGGGTSTSTISSESGGVFTMTNPPGCYFGTLGYSTAPASSGETDVYVIEPQGGGTYLQFLFPPAQGETWAAGGASGAVYEWDEHYDTYTVPAGTFSDCWHMTVSGNTAVLCRDVGEVSFNSTNLVSKNF